MDKPIINDNWIQIPNEWTEEQRHAHYELAATNPRAAKEELLAYWKEHSDDAVNQEFEDNVRYDIESKTTAFRKLSNDTDALTEQIMSETDLDKFNDLTNLFEMNHRKKNMARINRLSNLLEMVDDEVILRLSTSPSAIEDKDLVGYMKTAQSAIDSIEGNLNQTPLVQINNQKNEIHINESGLNQESRKKVLDAVMAILENAKTDNIIEVEDTEWSET